MIFLCAFLLLVSLTSVQCTNDTDLELAAKKAKTLNLVHLCVKSKNGDNSSDDATIFMIHGLGMSKEHWNGIYQVLALKTGKRVCIMDLRNHGDSPHNGNGDVEIMAEDIIQLMKTEKTQKAILIGHSLGGKIAVHIALKYPEKIEKLIVEDMRPNGITTEAFQEIVVFMGIVHKSLGAVPRGTDETRAKELVVEYINKNAKKKKVSFMIDEKSAQTLPLTCTRGLVLYRCKWKTNLLLYYKVIKNPMKYLTNSNGLFEGPTLFVYGKKSPFKIKENKDEIQALFPNSKFYGVEGASHMIHGVYPEFDSEVIKFINDSEGYQGEED